MGPGPARDAFGVGHVRRPHAHAMGPSSLARQKQQVGEPSKGVKSAGGVVRGRGESERGILGLLPDLLWCDVVLFLELGAGLRGDPQSAATLEQPFRELCAIGGIVAEGLGPPRDNEPGDIHSWAETRGKQPGPFICEQQPLAKRFQGQSVTCCKLVWSAGRTSSDGGADAPVRRIRGVTPDAS